MNLDHLVKERYPTFNVFLFFNFFYIPSPL